MSKHVTHHVPELIEAQIGNGLSGLCDFSPLGCFILDWRGHILEVNNGGARMLRARISDLISKSFSSFVDPEDHGTFMLHKEEVFLSMDRRTCELRVLRHDGTVFDAGLQSMAVQNYSTNRFHVIVSDVTEKNELIRVLETSQEKLKLAIEGSGLGLWDWTIPTGEVFFNERWAEMVGYELSELEPTIDTWASFCHPDDLFEASQKIQKHFFEGIPEYECEVRMKHRNGHWIWVLDRGKVTQWDKDGNALRMTGTHLDITERKRFEMEKESLNSQLVHYSKMQAINDLVGGLAHDFNNILQGIIGFSQLLMMENTQNDSGRKKLETIIKLGNEQADIIKKLLLFGKEAPTLKGSTNAKVLIKELQSVLSATLHEKYQIDVNIGDKLNDIDADANQIFQALVNLAINASEAMPKGGKITITANGDLLNGETANVASSLQPGSFMVISVSDTGSGIDEEVGSRMFDPFFSTKERGSVRGTGLGLSVARSIIESHGGYMDYESESGRGTTFNVYLPVIDVN